MNWFGNRKSNRSSEPRSWDAVSELIERLSLLCDDRFGRRDIHMWTTPEHTSITLKIKGNDFRGEGQTPWEAASNLASQAASLSASITDILADKQDDIQEAA